jgi:hypothetical protein
MTAARVRRVAGPALWNNVACGGCLQPLMAQTASSRRCSESVSNVRVERTKSGRSSNVTRDPELPWSCTRICEVAVLVVVVPLRCDDGKCRRSATALTCRSAQRPPHRMCSKHPLGTSPCKSLDLSYALEMHENHYAAGGCEEAPNRGKRLPVHKISKERSAKYDRAEQHDGPVSREEWRDCGRGEIHNSNRYAGRSFSGVDDVTSANDRAVRIRVDRPEKKRCYGGAGGGADLSSIVAALVQARPTAR